MFLTKKFVVFQRSLYFFIPEPTFFSSVEEFFVCELMFGFEWKWSDESSSFFSYDSHEFAVDLVNLTILETIPIGWIGDDDTFWDWSSYKILHRKSNIIEDSCSFGISLRYLYHLGSDITRQDGIFTTWVDLASGSILYVQEYLRVKKPEFLHSEVTRESWSNIASDHDGFDRNSSWSTEGVNERNGVLPVCECYECCGEIFFDRSLSSFSSISSLVEWISRDIDEDMSHIIDDEDENMYLSTIGQIRRIECREDSPLPHTLNRWDTLEGRSRRWCLDDDSFLAREIIRPLESVQCIIESVEILYFLRCELDIDTIRKSAPDKELIHIPVSSCTRDESILGRDLGTTESLTLAFDEWLEAWLTREYESSCWGVGSILHVPSVWKNGEIAKCIKNKNIILTNIY